MTVCVRPSERSRVILLLEIHRMSLFSALLPLQSRIQSYFISSPVCLHGVKPFLCRSLWSACLGRAEVRLSPIFSLQTPLSDTHAHNLSVTLCLFLFSLCLSPSLFWCFMIPKPVCSLADFRVTVRQLYRSHSRLNLTRLPDSHPISQPSLPTFLACITSSTLI